MWIGNSNAIVLMTIGTGVPHFPLRWNLSLTSELIRGNGRGLSGFQTSNRRPLSHTFLTYPTESVLAMFVSCPWVSNGMGRPPHDPPRCVERAYRTGRLRRTAQS